MYLLLEVIFIINKAGMIDLKRINRKEDEEGAMGVGTLIVFIAMVLVAAVAASVLIDTANKLQQQAQKTGDQAIQEVSTAFTVKDVFAWNGADNNKIDHLTLKVGLAAGAPAQDLNQTVIQVSNNTGEANLIAGANENDAADGENYAWKQIIEQEGDDDQYLEQGDIYNITIDLNSALGGDIGTQEEIDIDIMPKHGTPTYEEITTPPVITTKIVDLT